MTGCLPTFAVLVFMTYAGLLGFLFGLGEGFHRGQRRP